MFVNGHERTSLYIPAFQSQHKNSPSDFCFNFHAILFYFSQYVQRRQVFLWYFLSAEILRSEQPNLGLHFLNFLLLFAFNESARSIVAK